MKTKEPLLSFEFADSNGNISPATFQNPIDTIVAHTIEEVLPCFNLLEKAIKKGYYAAGFLSYESSPAFDPAFKVREGYSMPLLWFGIFSEPQHQTISSHGTFTLTEWKPSVSTDEYDKAISSIKEFIENGVTYQTNYTIRLHSQFQGDDISFYKQLRSAQSSKYCAYIHTGEHSILSASPELFFHLKENTITTRPMKGTIERGKSFEEDEANAKWLYYSEKNRAENIMIVDLLRNDLGMIAESASVTVPKLFEIEHYPTVHQMTSTITASINEETPLVDIFKALFPCGSITGAPKISTMKIIADLETAPRELYCGAIGFITPEKEAIFNVPIRTVVIDQFSGKATYGVGGGITWDSSSEGEYEEVFTKARLLKENMREFQLIESILLKQGEYFLLEEHLYRLQNSAHYFGFQFNIQKIKQMLLDHSSQNSRGDFKVRLLLSKNGEITVDAASISPTVEPQMAMLAKEPISKQNPFLYHKTTNRDVYTKFQTKKPSQVFDVLLWNEEEELTEFTNGNVLLEIDGRLWTPPVSSGLLAGTFRNKLLKEGEIHEKVLTIKDLEKCTHIWFINSVRQWVQVQL